MIWEVMTQGNKGMRREVTGEILIRNSGVYHEHLRRHYWGLLSGFEKWLDILKL